MVVLLKRELEVLGDLIRLLEEVCGEVGVEPVKVGPADDECRNVQRVALVELSKGVLAIPAEERLQPINEADRGRMVIVRYRCRLRRWICHQRGF
jgi:hypothetical protein